MNRALAFGSFAARTSCAAVTALAGLTLMLGGCETRVVVDQAKPIDVNINFTGTLNLVIQDARQNLEQINGERPANIVRPEDIGLPAAGSPGSSAAPPPLPGEEDLAWADGLYPVGLATFRSAAPALQPIAAVDDAKAAMKARHPQLRALWSAKLTGESHTGLVVARGRLSKEQEDLLKAENADRTALYESEATSRKIKPEDVALSYYIARLGYAQKGDWYEKMNPATRQWEWRQWDR